MNIEVLGNIDVLARVMLEAIYQNVLFIRRNKEAYKLLTYILEKIAQYKPDKGVQKVKTLEYIIQKKDYFIDCKTYSCLTATKLIFMGFSDLEIVFFSSKKDLCNPKHVAIKRKGKYYDYLNERNFEGIDKQDYEKKYNLVEVLCVPVVIVPEYQRIGLF